jgi:hypothetical protein
MLTAGTLKQAALMRNNESVFLHIREQDCVAIEVRCGTTSIAIKHTQDVFHENRKSSEKHCMTKLLISFVSS